MRIIFAGTSEFAAIHLKNILTSKHQIIAVFTQPDRPAGRGQKLTASPVKILAKNENIPIFQPEILDCEDIKIKISTLSPDIIIVVAYGLIIPSNILAIPRLGCINVHASLLPRWRGAAPIQRAILAGDTETGITIIQMNEKLDSGDVLYQIKCDISLHDTSLTIHEKLAKLGSHGLINTLLKLSNGTMYPKKQNETLANYAKKINKEEAKINWNFSAKQLERCVRAFNPWPISFFYVNNQLIKVWKVSLLNNQLINLKPLKPGTIIRITHNGIQVNTTRGIINLITLQPSGKKQMSARDLINSRYEWFKPGTELR
ncbi:methionyl-tRNA formyltransferase [Pantoea sp. SoEX]|nr:methionyl-tRNA formyltransferase [Pantoea sp. SoEX]